MGDWWNNKGAGKSVGKGNWGGGKPSYAGGGYSGGGGGGGVPAYVWDELLQEKRTRDEASRESAIAEKVTKGLSTTLSETLGLAFSSSTTAASSKAKTPGFSTLKATRGLFRQTSDDSSDQEASVLKKIIQRFIGEKKKEYTKAFGKTEKSKSSKTDKKKNR